MVSPTQPIIVQASRADIARLARLIRESFLGVAKRFDLTLQNCPRHPSNYTSQWVEKDLDRGVRYFILIVDNAAVGCVGIEKAPQPSASGRQAKKPGKTEPNRHIGPPAVNNDTAQKDRLEVYMERLAVLPQHRGKGYGTRLARHALNEAQRMGAAIVGVGIIAADVDVKHFYQALGFKIGETKNFPHLPFSVTFMRFDTHLETS